MAKKKYVDLASIRELFSEDNFEKMLEFINEYGINSLEKKTGRNILLFCIVNEKTEWAVKISEQFKDLDVNLKARDGYSALHYAVQARNINVLETLLKNKEIIVDITDSYGNTPLWKAMFYTYKSELNDRDVELENIILKLLEAGADINKSNNNGIKPNKYLDEKMEKVNSFIKENKREIIK